MKSKRLFTMLGVMCLVLMGFSSARGTEFSDDFNRADSTTLGNGWTEVVGDLKILSNEVRNEAISVYHIAIQDGISGAVQDVACDFARTSTNGGPRFGVMLRYQDSQNYYYFYRQTGGTARVYIAKVVNGTLTNLANASSTNPSVNVLFRLEGIADGTTLKLKLDGVEKVSFTDSTFSSGKVGIQFGSTSSSTSHRADNFSAAIDVAPVAAFTGSSTSGDYPLTVNFTDQTQGIITSWSWDFGDSGTSTQQNPSHIYNSAGSFTVSLTVTSSSGSDIETKPNYIVVTTPPVPDANFSGTPLYGNFPMTVQFTNHTTGTVTSWSWTFGDGGTAAARNPEHTYNYAGLFTVNFRTF
jgi:PKD repeat protein